jgi:GLPGLI family protein
MRKKWLKKWQNYWLTKIYLPNLKIEMMIRLNLLLALFSSLILQLTVLGQTPFEGKVTGSMKAISLPDDMKGYENMFNQTVISSYKSGKVRAESQSMMGSTIVITDAGTKKITILIDMMGQKIAMQDAMEEGKKSNAGAQLDLENATIVETNETKSIAGYTCQKANVMMKDEDGEEIKTAVWFCKDLPAAPNQSKLKGMIMQYELQVKNITLQYTVETVSKEDINDSAFTIPAGYEIKTKEELEKMFPQIGQ